MAGAIVCGVDDSESAKRAARVARALSARLGVHLIFVRVVEPNAADANASAVAERLEQLRARAHDADSGAAWLVDAGDPADGLIAAARGAGASMIVVGSTGRRSSLLGSISADVSRRAPCPVVVVPPGANGRVNGNAGERVPGANDRDFAGGIARFGFGEGGTEFAGRIARLGRGCQRVANRAKIAAAT